MAPLPTAALAPVVVLGLLLAGCGGSSPPAAEPSAGPASASNSASGSSAASTPVRPTGTAPPGFASTSAGSPRDVISKPDFLIDANALCSRLDTQLQALPQPTAATDYAATVANLTGTLRIRTALISGAEALVVRAGERADLEKNWLDVERADFAAFQPAAQRVIDAARRHDPARVQAAVNDLSAVRDHDATVAAYLDRFGLASCAHLYID
jgi:hypothetical protein